MKNKEVSAVCVTANGLQYNTLGIESKIPAVTQKFAIRNSMIATDKGLYPAEKLILEYKNSCFFSGKHVTAIVICDNGISVSAGEDLKIVTTTTELNPVFKSIKDLREGDSLISAFNTKSFGTLDISLEDSLTQPFRATLKKRKPLTAPKKMTYSLARFLGYLMVTDCVRVSKVEFSNPDEDILEDFKDIISTLFGAACVRLKSPAKGIGGGLRYSAYLKITSMEFVDYIGYIMPETLQDSRIIPKVIFTAASKNYVAEFIKAMTISGRIIKDGFVVCRGIDYRFVRDVVLLLSQFGIEAAGVADGTLEYYKSINDPDTKAPAVAIVVKDYDAIAFHEKIGFLRSSHIALADKMVQGLKHKLKGTEKPVKTYGFKEQLQKGLIAGSLALPEDVEAEVLDGKGEQLSFKTIERLSDIGVLVPEVVKNPNLMLVKVIKKTVSSYAVSTYDVYAEKTTPFICNNSIFTTA